MRGIAALSVMIFHYTINNDMLTWPKNTFFIDAYLAVDFFFILSGFVISHSYGDRVYVTMTAKQYLIRRFIRLYPLFILGLLLGTPVLYVLATYSIPTYPIRSVLVGFAFNAFGVPFLNNLGIVDMGATAPTVIGVIFPSNPPAWSLFFEMIASFAFLFLIKMHFDSLIKIV